MTHPEFAVVLTTCQSRSEAKRIASRLVTDHTAACVNIVDKITSIYEWKGKIEESTEVLMIIKTRWILADRVAGTIQGFSSYDCPEVVVLPIIDGSEEYLGWLTDVTAESE